MIRFFLFFIPLFMIHPTLYSFYDFYGDIPFQYKLEFNGKMILSSKFINYTNTNANFNILYTLETSSEFSTPSQLITDWYFSDLQSTNLPSIVPNLWRNYILQKQKEIAYVVKLNTDNFLAFDKEGKLHPVSYLLEIFIPVIDKSKPLIERTFFSPSKNIDSKNNSFLNLKIRSWDFFQYTPSLTDEPLLMLETNTTFINEIYQKYSQTRQNKQPTLFWLQHISANRQNTYQQVNGTMELTGMYFIDLQNRLVNQATIVGKISSKIPYNSKNYNSEIDLYLEGKFTIQLIYPNINTTNNTQPTSITLDNFIQITQP